MKKIYFCWEFLAVFCLLYFIVCVISVGFKSAFIYIWLFAAAFFESLFIIAKSPLNVPMWLKIGFGAVFTLCVMYFCVLEICVISKMNARPEDGCDYMIVLGAHVRGEVVSRALAQRLDMAYDYAVKESNKECRIIVSGGQGSNEDITEALAMKRYLVAKGLEESRIFMEDKSTDTNENIELSADMYIKDKSAKVVIVTNNFHVFRSIQLAKADGLKNVSGLAAPCNIGLLLNYMVREAVGITKEIVYGNF